MSGLARERAHQPGVRRTAWWMAVAMVFVLLTALVATGATASADTAIRDTMRPHDVWGRSQVWADVVVEGLRSEVMAALVVIAAAVFSVVRRSWTPLAHGMLLVLASSGAVAAAKLSLSRTDPHHDPSSIGSFPSGHVMFVLVGLGGLLIVSGLRTSWLLWAVVGAATVAMGAALLIQGAHWGSDVLGGALLGLLVLGATDHLVQRRASDPSAGLGAGTAHAGAGTSSMRRVPRSSRPSRAS